MTNPSVRSHIPDCAWQRPLGLGWEQPYTVRYDSNLDDGPWHGMPLGGLGAGCIGRSPRGDFNLWHIDGGEHVFQNLPACQFSVFEEMEGGRSKTYALSTEGPDDGTLGAWQWYPPTTSIQQTGTYSALYPQSWYEYQGVYHSHFTCEQFSPVIPHNYQESSYPVAIFEWTAHNPTDRPITLSILLTWENTVGWFTNSIKTPEITVRDDGSPVYEYEPCWGQSTDNYNRWIENNFRVGCLMSRRTTHDIPQEGEGQWAIATIANPAVEVFYHTRWDPTGDGTAIWDSFATDGSLADSEDETPAAAGERLACAIAVRFTLRPGRTRKIPFILAWDFPVTEFGYPQNSAEFRGQVPSTDSSDGSGAIAYYRRYTDFFGRNGNNAWSMVRTAFKHSDTWKEQIARWRQPILNDGAFPNSLKMALFNELYLLADGGTLWTAASETDPIGQFGVLECLDYRWYESLDVRLYGGFALSLLWPKLEKAVMLAFARAISQGDNTPRIIGYDRSEAVRKITSATPHDLGAPNEHPWQRTNYTSYQDCNLWKDLGSDFVLQVYRYFLWTGAEDKEFLQDCWMAIAETLDYLKTFDRDGDGIPENSGAPDQTFDDWRLKGISAYCGGLWLAGLQAAIAIGKELLDTPELSPAPPTQIQQWSSWLEQAQPLYHQTLWNGKYYNLDSESGSSVVMADQLCGQFYANLLQLPAIVSEQCAQVTLQTIYDACFVQFNQHQAGDRPPLGIPNGVNPDGAPEDPNATHPLEIWTGINFGLAAFMLQQGMKVEALEIAEAVVDQIYSNGLQFRTPEAITAAGTFRASHYLRAMAIWGLYYVWDNNQ